MAFILEDGNGLVNSNAYADATEYKDYQTDRGQFATGDNTDAEIEQALINASDYIDKRFADDFKGYKQSNDQAMAWPRVSALDSSGFLFEDVPAQLKKGTIEYAWLWLKLFGPGKNLAPVPAVEFPTVDPETGETEESSGMLTAIAESVGPISESKSFSSSASNRPVVSSGSVLTQHLPEYPQADLWIEKLLDYGNQELGRG